MGVQISIKQPTLVNQKRQSMTNVVNEYLHLSLTFLKNHFIQLALYTDGGKINYVTLSLWINKRLDWSKYRSIDVKS